MAVQIFWLLSRQCSRLQRQYKDIKCMITNFVLKIYAVLRKLRINTNMLLTPYFYTNIFFRSNHPGDIERGRIVLCTNSNVHRLLIFGNIVVNIKYDLI